MSKKVLTASGIAKLVAIIEKSAALLRDDEQLKKEPDFQALPEDSQNKLLTTNPVLADALDQLGKELKTKARLSREDIGRVGGAALKFAQEQYLQNASAATKAANTALFDNEEQFFYTVGLDFEAILDQIKESFDDQMHSQIRGN